MKSKTLFPVSLQLRAELAMSSQEEVTAHC